MAQEFSVRDLALGFAVGFGAAALTPELRQQVRPLLKSALKTALQAVEGSQDKLAELKEGFDDLLAEVSHELARERADGADGAAGTDRANGSAPDAEGPAG